jgi:glucan 1,3-beta-glucosidase
MRGIHFHFLLSLLSLAAAPTPTYVAPAANITTPSPWGFPYGSQKVRGVNLGGWLLLEVCTNGGELPCVLLSRLVPSLFDNTGDSRIIDEWTFGQYQDYDTAQSALLNHWDTFITYQDFVDIKNAGCVYLSYW